MDTLPNGSPCRQLPQKHVWSSTVWCSADGLLWRRFYNPVSKQWSWADEPYTITIDEGGTVGYVLDWWMSADRCVALAWLHRAEGGSDRIQERVTVQLVDGNGSAASEEERVMRVDAIEWVDDGDAPEDGGTIPGEKWKPLRWSCGLIPCDARYRISNHGRLWSPHTRTITSGFFFDDERWGAVRGGSLVPLRAAAGLQAEERLQPRVRLSRDALMAGYGPSDLEAASGLELSTCWNYFTKASVHVPGKELRRRAPRIVPKELWGALERLKARGDEHLGGSLTDLIGVVQRMVPSRVLESEHVMSQLRLARTALLAP